MKERPQGLKSWANPAVAASISPSAGSVRGARSSIAGQFSQLLTYHHQEQ